MLMRIVLICLGIIMAFASGGKKKVKFFLGAILFIVLSKEICELIKIYI